MLKLKYFDQFKGFLGQFTKRPKQKGRPKLIKANAKTVNLAVMFGLALILFVGLLGGIRAMTLSNRVTNLEKSLLNTPKNTATTSTTTTIDNRLQYYLGEFVSYYFTIPEDTDGQELQAEKLLTFYVIEPDILSQGQTRTPSELEWSRLLQVKDNIATYEVHYKQKVKEGDKTVEKKLSTAFNIPYAKTDEGYYVSGLPWFSTLTNNQAGKVETSLNLGNDDQIASKTKGKLDKFLELFFTNYTTDQDNLDLVADGVLVLENSTFKTLDFTYYKENLESIFAYVQVTFEVAGATHSENFTLTLSEKGKSYYVTQLEHTIPIDYSKTNN